ncbi:MAG: beta-galactosidase, partial [Prevotella sp.]|nr:beta-galactosidase [Prevotella sp.]
MKDIKFSKFLPFRALLHSKISSPRGGWVGALLFLFSLSASAQRETSLINEGWKFSLGDASSPALDFGCGTEYFNYLTKAASIHNEGPYSLKFDDSKWQDVRIPHDWVENLPYASEASHSHGYKAVGYKYPKNSVGWYRKKFTLSESDKGKHFEILFDGIFRDSRVWVNGFYCGGERSGYLSQNYDITDYLNYDGDNLICVRADATLEEGWFYEGAGIYRNVWLVKTSPVHFRQDGISLSTSFVGNGYDKACLNISADIQNNSHSSSNCTISYSILDSKGNVVVKSNPEQVAKVNAAGVASISSVSPVFKPELWSTDSPYLYMLEANVLADGKIVDTQRVKFGVREVKFDKDRGLLLNGKEVKIKGVNLHQDHAGVGSAIPDGLQVYRIRQLKAMGCNAYRSSHNPMSPAMLDVCDSLGIMVIDENR